MLDFNKPIFQRGIKPATPSQPKRIAPITELPLEQLERKKPGHEDDWLHDRKDKAFRLKFIDGEVLEDTVDTFSVALHTDGSVMVFKFAVKFVAEVL